MGDKRELPKTFGLDVLLKLTRNNIGEKNNMLRKDPNGHYYTTDFESLTSACVETTEEYNITLKTK